MLDKKISKFLIFETTDEALEALLLFLLALFFYAFFIDDIDNLRMPNVYHGRDLLRALNLTAGKFIWFGPEMTNGGNLPGPFYYYLLSVPLFLFGSYSSIIIFQIVLSALASVILWLTVKKSSSPVGAMITYFLFLSSPIIIGNLMISWNPAFIYIFLALIVYIFGRHENLKMLFLGGVLSGLAIQIHLFASIFLGAALLSPIFSKNLGIGYRLKKIMAILSGAIIPLIPFFLKLTFSKIDTATEPATGYRWAAASFWDRTDPSRYSISEYLGYAKTFFNYLAAEYLLFPVIVLLILFCARIFKGNKFLAFSLFLSVLPVFSVIQILSQSRYLIPFVVIFAVCGGMIFSKDSPQRNRYCLYFVFLGIFFNFIYRFFTLPTASFHFSAGLLMELTALLSLGIFFVFFQFDNKEEKIAFSVLFLALVLNASYVKAVKDLPQFRNYGQIRIGEGQKLIRTILDTTGWSYSEFRDHTYFQGIDTEADFAFFYNYLQSKTQKGKSDSKYDGLIITAMFQNAGKIPSELNSLFSRGDIICKKEISQDFYKLCFYDFKNPDQKSRIHNIGYAYVEQNIPKGFDSAYGSKAVGENQVDFFWKRCKSIETCTVLFTVKIDEGLLHIEVKGLPVSVNVPAANPEWALNLSNSEVWLYCDGKISRVPIANEIGWRFALSTFLGPFDKITPAPCQKPEKITLSIPQAKSFVRGGPIVEKPFSLSWKRVN